MKMLLSGVQAILLRELGALRRSVEAYPDDASLWIEPTGIANSGGTLVLHLTGNLQHYLGSVLGRSSYQRDRAAEFARRGAVRSELLAEIAAAEAAVICGINALSDDQLASDYPEPVAGRKIAIGDFVIHLATHLSYHLGQLDYHRRITTGDNATVAALAPTELPDRAMGRANR